MNEVLTDMSKELRKMFSIRKNQAGIAIFMVIIAIMAVDFRYMAEGQEVNPADWNFFEGEFDDDLLPITKVNVTYYLIDSMEDSGTINRPGAGTDLEGTFIDHSFPVSEEVKLIYINITLTNDNSILGNGDLDLEVYDAGDNSVGGASTSGADESAKIEGKTIKKADLSGPWYARVKNYIGRGLSYDITIELFGEVNVTAENEDTTDAESANPGLVSLFKATYSLSFIQP